MAEYIERAALLETINHANFPEEDWDYVNNASYALDLVRNFPAADVVEVVHGRWMRYWHDTGLIGHEYAVCSVCDCHMSDTNQFWNSDYCPNCGADMRGE